MKLLIADDQISLHRYLDKVMDWEGMGFTDVRHAYDGEEAAALAVSFRPDILILDIHMPNLNGIESLKRVRESGHSPKTIILSAYDEFEYARDALYLQVSRYLLKPVDAAQLRDALGEIIRESAAAWRQAIGAELSRISYIGEMEEESFAAIRKGFEFFGIERFAVVTCADGSADGRYARWLQEQTEARFKCAMAGKSRHGNTILIGGREELTGGALQEFIASLPHHPDAPGAMPPIGISAIAQDIAALPLLIQESAQAAREPAGAGAGLQETVHRIKKHIDTRYHEDLSLQTVANQFRIDKYQLCRAFKKTFGVNYWSYVMKVRMEKAAELLAGTEWKNSAIAERTGFLDESHFSRAFKKYYGMAPKAYRHRQLSSR